ncbi:MAG: ABC transporter permease [Anaerolineae bacterium]|nr:ABC transporter permease [Anaerolineae bacterium]
MPVIAIVVALLVSAVVLLVAGYDPLEAYPIMWKGAFSDQRTFSEVLLKATPLILLGAGLSLTFRCGIVNLGAEGQFYAGSVVATLIGINFANLPSYLLIPLVLLGGALSGALWAMLAGYLKVRFNASEVVTTIMLNYVAIIFTGYLVTGPMQESKVGFPQTAQIGEAAWLPRFLPPTRLHIGFLIALLVALLIYILLFKTSTGYGIRAVGINAEAARYAGINVRRNILLAMAISGGAAGLGGAIEVTGLTYRLFQMISPGYGFDAIAVSLLVNNNPIATVLSGILFGALRSGSEMMQMNLKVPSVLVSAIQGIVILSVVAFSVYRDKILKWFTER